MPTMIKETDLPILVQLYGGTWNNYNPLHLLDYNNITSPIQKVVIRDQWFNAEETSFTNASRNFLKFDEVALHTECNEYGFITIPVVEITF